jgi:AP-1-like factor
MDYSYFPPAQQQQQYPFLGLPPTPAHTASANTSDEFSNSPSVCAPSPLYPSQNISYQSSSRSFSFSQSQSQSLSQSLSQSPYSPYASGSPRSSSNPTYPFVALTARQDDFSHFQNYDYAQAQYAPGSVPQVKPPTPLHKPSITASNGFDMSLLPSSEEMQRGSNSDEDEKDMTPAQSRRKAQNRAA